MKPYVFLIILFKFLTFSNAWSQERNSACPDLSGYIALKKHKIELSKKGKSTVDSIVAVLKHYPYCKLYIMGGNHFNSEMGQQIAWEEANAVRTYFLSKGISHDRMFIDYSRTFKERHVMIRYMEFCEECSPNTPPPHPLNNRGKKSKRIKFYLKNDDHE